MKRNTINLLLDLASALTFFALVVTGCLLYFVLPAGTGGRWGGDALALFGWTRHDFGSLHFYLACAAVLLAATHVALHWRWVCATLAGLLGSAKPDSSHRIQYGVSVIAGSIGALIIILLWANWQVDTVSNGDRQLRGGRGRRARQFGYSPPANGQDPGRPRR